MQRISGSIRLRLAAVALLASVAGAAAARTIHVTTTLDNNLAPAGKCTLRDAISSANSDTAVGSCKPGKGADRIALGKGLTYVLSVAGAGEDGNQTGDLDIDGVLAIDGNGSTIDGAGLDRVLDARAPLSPASPTSLSLTSLRLTGGSAGANAGGGCLRLRGNAATASHLTVDHCTSGFGGAITVLSGDAEPRSFHLDHGLIELNLVTNSGGGLYSQANASGSVQISIADSTIRNNQALISGGISIRSFNDARTSVSIERSVVSGNSSGTGGVGGIEFQGSADPNAVPDSLTVSINQSTIAGNTAVLIGGGLYNSFGAKLSLSNSTISGNAVTPLGVVPQTGIGGGFFNNQAQAVLSNVTVSGNTASGNPGIQQGACAGICNYGAAYPSSLALINTTVTDNHGSLASGVGTVGFAATGVATTTCENTIISGNTALAPFLGPSCVKLGFAVQTSLGHNIEDKTVMPNSCGAGCSAGCGFTGPADQVNTIAMLGPLADNGGPTKTHALLAGSPALDAADGATCAAAPVNGVDQRGVARPQGLGCDIGAYEYGQ